jgi:hypothetical protein
MTVIVVLIIDILACATLGCVAAAVERANVESKLRATDGTSFSR